MTVDFNTEWASVQGWFNWMALYDRMVEQVQAPATFVEIGIWQGRSTIYLANKIKQSGKPITFYAIDTFEGSPENAEAMAYFAAQGTTLEATFRDNLRRCACEDYVNVIVGRSLEAVDRFAPQSLDFVFIDGAHDYASVKADIAAWRTKVKPGGWMAGDDYNPPLWPGVVQAVQEAFPQHKAPLWWEASL
jgi:predicted O-methyltransferase YrrM